MANSTERQAGECTLKMAKKISALKFKSDLVTFWRRHPKELNDILQHGERTMNTCRPDFEALYKVSYRRHHTLLREIEDLLKQCDKDSPTYTQLTSEDLMGALRCIHETHIAHDWWN